MNIVQGRGRNRRVISLPHGSFFSRAAKSDNNDDRAEAHRAIGIVADLTLGSEKLLKISPGRLKKAAERTGRMI